MISIVKWQLLTIFIGLTLCVTSPVLADATLVGSYDFNNNLSDSLGNTTLATFPTNNTSGYGTTNGVTDPTFWYWTSSDTHGGGFYIDIPQNLLSSSDYSIGLRFAFNDLDTGYNKIIDYQNRTSDNGFYFLDRKIMFYPGNQSSGAKTINPGDVLDLVVTRNGTTNVFTVYFVVNGELTKEIEFTDTNNYAVATIVNNKVRFGFFDDDTAFAGSEATSDGKVYSVKFWNGAIGQSSVSEAMNPKYLVSFNDNVVDAEITMPTTQEVEDGYKASEPTTPTRTGYTFGGWYTSADLATQWNFNNNTVAQDTVLYAKWVSSTIVTESENPVVVSTAASNSTSTDNLNTARCMNTKPLSVSNLFQVNTTANSAKLFFTPIDVSQFVIAFSTRTDAEMHGEIVNLTREGVQSETINLLQPNTDYYIKVRGQNGCMPGEWSNIMKFRTNSRIYYKNFPSVKTTM